MYNNAVSREVSLSATCQGPLNSRSNERGFGEIPLTPTGKGPVFFNAYLDECKMTPSPFAQLYCAIGKKETFSSVYCDVLKKLSHGVFWTGGPVGLQRVLWIDGRRAEIEDPKAFASRGLYFWGVEDRLLYIGITCKSFRARFSRYIWSKRSQCNLAHDYKDALIMRGMKGFPSEIMERNSNVRRQGAIRFAKEGVSKIWFALLPHDNQAEIKVLEPSLVSIAEERNQELGLRSLLNVEFNKKRGTSKMKGL